MFLFTSLFFLFLFIAQFLLSCLSLFFIPLPLYSFIYSYLFLISSLISCINLYILLYFFLPFSFFSPFVISYMHPYFLLVFPGLLVLILPFSSFYHLHLFLSRRVVFSFFLPSLSSSLFTVLSYILFFLLTFLSLLLFRCPSPSL